VELVPLVEQLIGGLERLGGLEEHGAVAGSRATELRGDLLLSLRTKVLPELRAEGRLPVFVGVQGGTNVGKSTIFNALAGQLLSPSIVQASATKHPLVWAHSSWRTALLEGMPPEEQSWTAIAAPLPWPSTRAARWRAPAPMPTAPPRR